MARFHIQLVRDDPDDAFRDRLAGLVTDHLRRLHDLAGVTGLRVPWLWCPSALGCAA